MFNVKAQTTLEGLAQGIYKVEELDTMGFTLKEFTADTNCASQIAGNSAQFAVGIRKRRDLQTLTQRTLSQQRQIYICRQTM